MIQLHTSHGWLRPDLRAGAAWNAAQFFGGLAAPGFLLLAGVSLGMQWARETSPRLEKHAVRALQLVVLGYVLRLQMWSIDSGAMSRLGMYPAQLCLLAGYAGAYYGVAQLPAHYKRGLGMLLGALLAWALGITQVIWFEPHRVRGLLRVDVLQCIGASLLVLNGIAAASRQRRPRAWHLIAVAIIVGVLTPWLRAHLPGPLPHTLAAYFGQWPTSDTKPIFALFPLFPWLGFACVGAALGILWSRAASHATLERALLATVALGAWLALCTSEAWPPMFAFVRDHAWLANVVRLAYKVGLVLALLGCAMALARPSARLVAAPVMALGRTSLLIYWVHLEFAFGAASRPIARKLDIGTWAACTLVLIGAMWLLAVARLYASGRVPAPAKPSRQLVEERE